MTLRVGGNRCPTPDAMPRSDGQIVGIHCHKAICFEWSFAKNLSARLADGLEPCLRLFEDTSSSEIVGRWRCVAAPVHEAGHETDPVLFPKCRDHHDSSRGESAVAQWNGPELARLKKAIRLRSEGIARLHGRNLLVDVASVGDEMKLALQAEECPPPMCADRHLHPGCLRTHVP